MSAEASDIGDAQRDPKCGVEYDCAPICDPSSPYCDEDGVPTGPCTTPDDRSPTCLDWLAELEAEEMGTCSARGYGCSPEEEEPLVLPEVTTAQYGETREAPAPETLPATGVDGSSMLLVGALLLAAGAASLRRGRQV